MHISEDYTILLKNLLDEINLFYRFDETNKISLNDFKRMFLNSSTFYKAHDIPKKNRKKRKLLQPNEKMKYIQKYILKNIFYSHDYIFPECAIGYVKGKKLIENAIVHCNKPFILKIDLKDFFPNINRYKVYRALIKELNIAQAKAYILSRLTITNDQLPQGAATSPYLANLCTVNLDRRLLRLIEKTSMYGRSIEYTRYADDLTFSFNKKINFERFINTVFTIVNEEGFLINYEKTNLITHNKAQKITGIIVNNEIPSIMKKTRTDIVFVIKLIESHGIDIALNKYNKIFHKKITTTNFQSALRSKINFVKNINVQQGQSLEIKYNLIKHLFIQ